MTSLCFFTTAITLFIYSIFSDIKASSITYDSNLYRAYHVSFCDLHLISSLEMCQKCDTEKFIFPKKVGGMREGEGGEGGLYHDVLSTWTRSHAQFE